MVVVAGGEGGRARMPICGRGVRTWNVQGVHPSCFKNKKYSELIVDLKK